MEGGEHQVAGERGFQCGFGRFEIARFPHQQHIGVLAHEGPQGLGKVHPFLPVDLGLGDASQGVFDRIFHRGDVEPWIVAFGQK